MNAYEVRAGKGGEDPSSIPVPSTAAAIAITTAIAWAGGGVEGASVAPALSNRPHVAAAQDGGRRARRRGRAELGRPDG